MEEIHRGVHLAGTDLLARTSPSSAPSSAAAQLACAHNRPRSLLPLSHWIVLKHLQEPQDSTRLEEVNSAVRDRVASAPVDAGGGKRTAGMSSLVIPVAHEVTGQLVSVVAKAAYAETDGQELADSARPGELISDRDNIIHSDHMVCALGSVRTYMMSVPERKEVASGPVLPASEANALPLDVSRKACDGANQHEVTAAPERTDARVVEEAATVLPRSLDVAISLPSTVPAVIGGEEDQTVKTHLQVPAQETSLDLSLDPAAEPWASSPSNSSYTDGDDDLYNLGVAAAMKMDTEALQAEVDKYFRREAKRGQRSQRRAATHRNPAANPAPPMKFSLRLSNEEAMEDVAALSQAKDVNLEAEVPAPCRNAKRRRRG
ncbi:unnamed protein product [Alopecurus aequalis]